MTVKSEVEKTKRMRVKGEGPSRDKLVIFKKLGEVSPEVVAELNQILEDNPGNDIWGDKYKISNAIDCKKAFDYSQETYRQALLQYRVDDEFHITDERGYHTWRDDYNFIPEVEKYFKQVCRFRCSELQPGGALDWHIDTDTSVMCRAQICLNENDAKFMFKDKEGVHTMHMKPGELWFINTGYPHTVQSGDMVRRVAVFAFEFKNLLCPELVYRSDNV